MQPVTLVVNGDEREAVVEPLQTLLSVLRDSLGLTGTKEGCGTGYCGACTVLVDGEPVNACLFPAVDADRRDVTTIEGLADDEGELHPVQAAFIEQFGLQCGYCTPGMILAAASLIADNPQPSDEQIRAGLAGNICRCTGYQSIVAAVTQAANQVRATGRAGQRPGRRGRVRARA
ncbi:MAG: (2Fe-2S)-binding protein [Candidatus Eremiobacteraeota bacterium]|nr:(2Fe-2S)-binding protein [Candidatus Eremiobacteraeota bacterium]MBV8366652.1 (2Fe-2S)-binding protein [Candidatus Eremiobacteraeota bacterium]